MGDNTIQKIKDLLNKKVVQMQYEINTTITTMLPEELMIFENQFYADYEYYEKKYANEETVKEQIIELYGCFPIEYILSEVNEYIYKKVYLAALWKYIQEHDI